MPAPPPLMKRADRPLPYLVAVLSVCAALVVMHRLSINTDTGALIDPNLPWQQDNAALDKAFPQNTNLLAIVIDGQTPELAESAANVVLS